MEKHSLVTLDINVMLKQLGMDPNQFKVWNEFKMQQGTMTNPVIAPPSQKQ